MLTIRPMRADDDLDAELDLRHRSFGPMDAAEHAFWRDEMLACIADDRQFGAWDGGRLVGAARYYDMRQFWHGRPVPMAGVGGVKVAPEARGRGVGKALMSALLQSMTARGYALSVLYPATARLYRSLGWEMAGGHYRAEVPGRSLGSLLRPDPDLAAPGSDAVGLAGAVGVAGAVGPAGDVGPVDVRRAGPQDARQVIAVLSAVHAAARDCGPATIDTDSVSRWLADPDLFSYLAADGFVGYGWHRGGNKDILVHVLAAASAPTARTLWGIVASHASVTEVVHVVTGPHDPVSWLVSEPDVRLRVRKNWMLRVLDPAGAIAARGFPAGVRARVALWLADPARPAGAGPHTLTVRDGEGRLVSGATAPAGDSPSDPPVALGPRGLAALYAGVPMATLRVAGLAAGGGPAADAALDAAFGCQAYLLDYF